MYCPKCGFENKDEVTFCAKCGYNYVTEQRGNVQPIKKNNKSTGKKVGMGCGISVLVVFLLFIGLFVLGALMLPENEPTDANTTTNNSQVDDVQKEDNTSVQIYEDDIVKASFVKVYDIDEVSSAVDGVSYMQLYIENKSDVTFTVSFKNAAVNGMSTTIGSGLPVTILPGNASQQAFILFTTNTNVESAEDIYKIQFQISLYDENFDIVDETPVITIDVK